MTRNTDVPGTIAGYHKQVYMACLTLVELKNDNDSIGIECGADVRTFYEDGSKKSCEVKFYKDNFSKYSQEIMKTIYNFYINSNNDKELIFTTNVGNTDKEFFDGWKEGSLCNFEKKRYILHALIKLEETKDDKLKKKLENYNGKPVENMNNVIENLTVAILKHKSEKLEDYINNSHITLDKLLDFSNKLNFNFEDKDKETSIGEIKERIVNTLKTNFKDFTGQIEEKMYRVIMYKTAMLFYDSTITNSLQIYNDGEYKKYVKVSVKDLKEIIINYEKYIDRYSEDILLTRLIEVFDEKEVMNIKTILNNFKDDYEAYESLLKNSSLEINSTTIKYLFKEKNIKFISSAERDVKVERYKRYHQGLGLIGFLMDLDISSLNISKDKVRVTTFYNRQFTITNIDHYVFSKLSYYLKDKSVDNDEIYKYVIKGHFSFLEIIYSHGSGIIDVYKQERSLSLVDYVEFNGINNETYGKLQEISSNAKQNTLILYSGNARSIKLINALAYEIPEKQTVFIVAEDVQSKLSSEFGRSIVEINSLSGDFSEKFELLNEFTKNFDRKIYIIHNYEYFQIPQVENILSNTTAKGFIIPAKTSIKNITNITFEQVIEQLNLTNSYTKENIDHIIFLNRNKKLNEDASSRIIDFVKVISKT
ncbi:hypothetical protein AS52_03668 [Priestia megaterium Q3]|uniref:Uncharacterized protein n=1 Tax=Priestia megaterium Q3 TaxID=1452722 RepID=A0A806TSB6_PRIMG|nr:hypothetical protein [Priestia megaterium]AKP78629.1 hypothetical protein AS52_03668 [Priestia megaterium Q3]